MTKEKQRINAEEVVSNLSDFALFLTVMKNREAYRNTLSIIMDEPEIEIEQVKVEEVILNKSGKRAIRLDAWQKQKIRGFLIWKCRMRDIRILCQRDPGIIRECWTGRFSDQGNVPDTGICHLQRLFLLRRKIFFKRI